METVVPFPNLAIFCCPEIPGPDIKKAKTSLNVLLFGGANFGYSSDPNTYLNLTVSDCGTISICK